MTPYSSPDVSRARVQGNLTACHSKPTHLFHFKTKLMGCYFGAPSTRPAATMTNNYPSSLYLNCIYVIKQ